MFGDGARFLAGITAAAVVALVAPLNAGAATISVDTNESTAVLNDNCSLREAILAANDDASEDGCRRGNGRDKIAFDIAGSTMISPTTKLPALTEAATVDGTTEPDYAGSPIVRVDGGGTVGRGLRAEGRGDDVTFRGLVVTNFSLGIRLEADRGRVVGSYVGVDEDGDPAPNTVGVYSTKGVGDTIGGLDEDDRNVLSGNDNRGVFAVGPRTRILGNYIGTDPTGNIARPNEVSGIEAGAADCEIRGNVISGNGDRGIFASGPRLEIRGNLIGLRADGQSALGNVGDGIELVGERITVGGSKARDRNVISGNNGDGIGILGAFASRARVSGNYIGLDADGDNDLGNAGMGVRIVESDHNLIGGDQPDEANVISDNTSGVLIGGGPGPTTNNVVSGNLIGTDPTGTVDFGNQSGTVRMTTKARNNLVGGTRKGEWNLMRFTPGGSVSIGGGDTAIGNSILGNSAYDNGEEVIDLAENGVTPNDVGPPSDTDTGPNNLQNFPFLFGGDEQTDGIFGTLDSEATTKFRIEFFVSDQPGDAQRFVGAKTIKTGADGHDDFHFTSPKNLPAGDFLTATATRLDGKDLTDTSELSDDADVSVGP